MGSKLTGVDIYATKRAHEASDLMEKRNPTGVDNTESTRPNVYVKRPAPRLGMEPCVGPCSRLANTTSSC